MDYEGDCCLAPLQIRIRRIVNGYYKNIIFPEQDRSRSFRSLNIHLKDHLNQKPPQTVLFEGAKYVYMNFNY